MLIQEAKWLGKKLQSFESTQLDKMLNIGSSTKEFRSQKQPYIEKCIFFPLQKRGIKVDHLDMKMAEGVDIVGDLSDVKFVDSLKNLKYKSIICSNLLEHVNDPRTLCNIMADLLTEGGILIVTVPFVYPYHKDPIDTLFRPNVVLLSSYFPLFYIVESDIVRDEESLFISCCRRPKKLFATIFRYSNFFSRGWYKYISYIPYFFTHYSATCLILQKKSSRQ